MEVQLETVPNKKTKIEIPNFDDKESQFKFRQATTNTNEFTDCFKSEGNLMKQCDVWLSKLKAHIKTSFKKIRIRPVKIRPSAADPLIKQRNSLLKHGEFEKSQIIDAQIAKIISKEGRIKANMFRKFCNPNRSHVLSEMWQLKKKLFPRKTPALPSAKYNYQGKIVTEPNELTKLMGKEYGTLRLRKRPCHPLNNEIRPIRNKLLKLKLFIAKQKKTDQFLMTDLEVVLKGLKTKKARGPDGLSRTLFRNSIIGTNLKDPLLQMFNKIKDAGKLPNFMKKATVITIPKKGSNLKLQNERGIFLVNTVRSILMRLVFNLKYSMFESNMSDSNIGGRRKKSGINHIWVMNNVIHDQLSCVKKVPIVIQKFDYKQMFDGMDNEEACGDMFNYGVNDDHLTMIHEANSKIVICVKTPQGVSEPYTLINKTMQGDTWAPAMASAQVDSFGKEMLENQPSFMFKFNGEVPIPLLGQVDDLLGVAEAGLKVSN